MFGLKVGTEGHGVLELLAALLEQVHGVAVGHAGTALLDHAVQVVQQAGSNELVEEGDIVSALLDNMLDRMLDETFSQFHVVPDIVEGGFGLDHPELGGMAGSVGMLSAEGRTEGIDLAEAGGQSFGFKLAGHGEAGGLAEEVILEEVAGFGLGAAVHGKGGHAEHFAGTFAVGTGEDGGVNVVVALTAEVVMDGHGRFGTDAESCAVLVGAGAQMGDGTQEFVGVALLLEREGRRVGKAEHSHGLGADFPLLALAEGFHEVAADAHGGAGVHTFKSGPGFGAFIDDDLKILEAGAVVEFEEGESLGIAAGTHPAADGDAIAGFKGSQSFADAGTLHRKSLQGGIIGKSTAEMIRHCGPLRNRPTGR